MTTRVPGLLATTVLLSACTVGPDFVGPEQAAPPPQTAAAMAAGTRVAEADWWRVFDDRVLDILERRALAGNLDLAEAAERVRSSRAELRIAGAGARPRAGAAASYMRERASDDGILALTGAGQPAPNAADGADPFGASTLPADEGGAFDLYQIGFDAAWEPDLWGRARRTREASRADTWAAIYDREAMRVSLSAEVARTYAALRGAQVRLDVLQQNRTAVSRGLAIAQRRRDAGATDRYDAATAAAQLAAIDAQVPAARREIAERRNALALLAGLAPHALDTLLTDADPHVPDVPAALPGRLPSELARHRPDILSAEAALHAATARIGVARADFYPSLSLGGSFGTQALAAGNLSSWSARQFLIGPVLHLPFFEGGRLKGRLELTQANQKAAAIRYRATVLRAWHEVDDALEAARTDAARVAAARRGVAEARVAVHVATRRYKAGASGYLNVLIAQRAVLAREDELASAQTDQAVTLAALYKALGGGWDTAAVERGIAG